MRRMRLLKCCGAAILGLAFGIGAASAQEPTKDKTFELKLSHWVPPTHPLHKAIEEWGADVEKASGGTITYKIFPSQQLGKAFDHYDMARDGIADLTYVNPGYQPGRFPIIAAGELPFLVGDSHGGIRAIDKWYRKYAASEMKGVKYCFSFILDPLTWHSKTKKIVVPGDIKGMKIRPSQATVAAWVTLLGGTNVQASATEVRDVIEKGVAEAVNFPWGSIAAARRGQGHEVSHGRAGQHSDVPVADESEGLRGHVAGAKESHRRPLHDRLGGQVCRSVGGLRARRTARRSRRCPATRFTRSPTSSFPSGRSRPSRYIRSGRTMCAPWAAIPTRS